MVKDQKYGLPSIKKYPMPDPKHVKSAIKFFNYVDKKNEQELADAILSRIKEYNINIENLNIGDDNRFKKYILKTELMHHGIKGMHWGIRRFQNPDGSLTEARKKRQYNQDYKQAKKDMSTAKYSGELDANLKERIKIADKIAKEMRNNKDISNYNNMQDYIVGEIERLAKESGINATSIRLDRDTSKMLFSLQDKAMKEAKNITEKYIDDFAKATLNDINSPDTQAGRDYVSDFLRKSNWHELDW